MAVQISGVEVREAASEQLLGSNLERPRAGEDGELHTIALEGWVVGRETSVEAVAVTHEGRTLIEIPVDIRRPDIEAAFADRSQDDPWTGFAGAISAFDFPESFELGLMARLRDGSHLVIATVRGRRDPLPRLHEARLQPLLINTIGRSGSTFLTRLLSAHPEVVAFNPLAYDARVATYWMAFLQDALQPQSYLQQVDPGDLVDRHWWLGDAIPARVDVGSDAAFRNWVRATHVPQIAHFCQASIEGFYSSVTDTDGARYFVEKVLPYQVQPNLLAELYPRAREIVLVRDFRDVLCSIQAFNEKRGYAAFGATPAESTIEYLRRVLAPSAIDLAGRWRNVCHQALLVRYEDLVLDPIDSARRVIEYVGVESGSGLLSKVVAEAQADPASDAHRTVADPAGTIGRWKHELEASVALECEKLLQQPLEALGYGPDGPRER